MQKFVITTDGELRFGDVHLHKELLPWGDEDCYGGGFWKIDEGGMGVALYGCSYDFGEPNFNELKSIDWDSLIGKPISLIYYPNYPNKENSVVIA